MKAKVNRDISEDRKLTDHIKIHRNIFCHSAIMTVKVPEYMKLTMMMTDR